MKYITFIFIGLISIVANGEIQLTDLHSYNPGESRDFSLHLKSPSRLCIKIPDVGNVLLKKQCNVRGGCLVLSDRTNNRSYGYNENYIILDYDKSKKGRLDFSVKNKYPTSQNIGVALFNPNRRIDKVLELASGGEKDFTVQSDTALSVFARIQLEDTKSLVEACSPTGSCLNIEYYDEGFKSWSLIGSDLGIGKALLPDSNRKINFRVINKYRMSLKVRVTASDIEPDLCRQ